MAEGGKRPISLNDSFSKASGDAVEIFSEASADADESFCEPCKTVGNWKVASGYCQVCEEYLCDVCFGVHRRQKLTKTHAILDKNHMPSGQRSVTTEDLCVELCKTHHPEIIRFFCIDHDEPGCGDCMTLNHSTCTKYRVQDISKWFQNEKEIKDTDQLLQQLHQELEEISDLLGDNLKDLDTSYNSILHKIQSIRKQMNEYLDEIEKQITNEAAKMKDEDEAELKSLIAESQAMKMETDSMLQAIHDANVNVNSLFVITKQAKRRLATMETEINKIKEYQPQDYDCLVSGDIETLMLYNTPLGNLTRYPKEERRTTTRQQDHRETPTVDSTATYNRSVDVKGETDIEDCSIIDSTLLDPERLVVIDVNNKNVKLIDLCNNTVISTYSTAGASSGVTALSTSMIAVTLRDESKIQILNVTSTFTLHRIIKVNKNCYGIAYKDGKFSVSYSKPGMVEIVDMLGKKLHTIKDGDEYKVGKPYFIKFGHDNDTLVVSDYETNKVSVVTYSGKLLRTFAHGTMKCPFGIALTTDGVLFVCNWERARIHIVSPDFKTSKIIITSDNYVEDPRSITYCGSNNRLYISNSSLSKQRGGIYNQIQVYDVNV